MLFAADLNDILLTGQSATITFEIQKGGTVILRERYSPDNDQCIRIGGLAKIANTCLYGSLGSSSQASCHATFSFSHGMSSEDIYACLRRVNRTPSAVLSLADESTMVAGHPHLLTLLQSCNYTVMSGSTQLSNGSFSASGPTTVDVQSKYNAQATHMVIGGEHTVWFDHGSYADALCVRFLNVFDVPQTVVFRLGATLKPSFTADDGVAYGFTRRYAVEAKDDITLKSGALQAELDAGDMEIQGKLMGRTRVATDAGDIEIDTPLARAEYALKLRTDAGDMEVKEAGRSAEEYEGGYKLEEYGGPHKLNVRTFSGDVEVHFGN